MSAFDSLAKLQSRVVATEPRYGAVGDGVTDNTAVIHAALATGRDVYLPAGHYLISADLTLLDGQTIYGDGEQTIIEQTTSLANVISATSKTGCVVRDLKLVAVGTQTSIATGNGVLLTGCTDATVRNVTVTDHRGRGVCLFNTNDSTVENCTFRDSPLVDGEDNTDGGDDIAVVYSSSRNVVRGNHCLGGNLSGIKVQTILSGDEASDNVIVGNVIKGAKSYGIIVYRNDDSAPLTETLRGNVITGNTILDTTGTIVNSFTGDYNFGAAIYLQGAEDTAVVGNTIRGSHTGAVTRTELLAPGAIGATNCHRYVISGNIIEDAREHGMYLADPANIGDSVGHAVVTGNKITNSGKDGIKILRRGRIVISGNAIDTSGDAGIALRNTALKEDISITGNIVANSNGGAGIYIDYGDGVTVTDNIVNTASTSGVTVLNSSNVKVQDNTIRDPDTRGVFIQSTVTGAEVGGNTVIGTGSTAIGVQLDALTTLTGANRITGCTTAIDGTFAGLFGSVQTAAVGNVGTGEDDLMSYTIPAGALAKLGDSLNIRAFGSITNNANAKTLKMYFGSTLILTTALTTSQLGVWEVEAEIMYGSSGNQRAIVRLTQGGTTTISDVEQLAATETTTSAIVVKFTGEATADDDIRQLGMVARLTRP